MLIKPPAQVHYCTSSASDVRTQVNRINANYNNVHVKFYMQIFLICMYFLSCVFLHVFACLHKCFMRVFLVEFACSMAEFHAWKMRVMLQRQWPVMYLPHPPLPKSISEFFPEGRGGCTHDIIYVLYLMYHQHNINLMVYHWGVQQNN